VPDGHSKWRWVPGSEWRIDGADSSSKKSGGKNGKNGSRKDDDAGWIYYDNKVSSPPITSIPWIFRSTILTISLVERRASWARWLGAIYSAPQMVSGRGTCGNHLEHCDHPAAIARC
jgi:hypothetical protein